MNKNEEVYVTYHGLRRYGLRITDHRLRITHYAFPIVLYTLLLYIDVFNI
jgi:hypothetical protein